MRITMLGTGTSHGVPSIDCMLENYARCPHQVCLKAVNDPRHRRTRASILVEWNGSSLLVDTSQDFRQQMLDNQVHRLDAVLYTHAHADHIFGLPDIRSFCRGKPNGMDIYGAECTLEALRRTFDYIFNPPAFVGGGIPTVQPHPLEAPAEVLGLHVTPIPVLHGNAERCQGYRIENMAYIPDAKVIPDESLALLEGLDLLILNCLRPRPHISHLCLEESLAYAQRLQPRRCLLTHMTHDIDYAHEEPNLPDWVRFGYDGLVIEV